MNEEDASVGLRIFLNYRRDDAADAAGRLYDALAERFGEERVFMDIDTIEPGVDFEEVVNHAVDSCDVVLAVIGRQWLTITDAKGRRRMDNPDDFVRMELEAALARDVRVLPVLVQGVEMPASDDLPEPLKKLARRNALEMSHARWSFDVGRLMRALEKFGQEKSHHDQATRELEEEEAAAANASRDQARREHVERETAAAERARQEAAAHASRAERLPAPGWYPDPEVDGRMRWWDGEAWTDRRHQSVASTPAVAALRSDGRTRSRLQQSLWVLWPILSFGILAVVGFYLAGRREGRTNWALIGGAYSVAAVVGAVLAGAAGGHHSPLNSIAGLILLFGWLGSGIHAVILARESTRVRSNRR